METDSLEPLPAILQRMQTAQNHHDLDAFVQCFASDYESEQPVHPGVAFVGRDQVRKNWAMIFGNVPDFRSELLHWATAGETVWAEWQWHGTRRDAAPLDMRGVTLFRVQHDQIVWARLYMEPVQVPSGGIDAQVQRRMQGSRRRRSS